MNAETRIALGLGLALIVTCAALAQTPTGVPGAPPSPVVQRAGSVEYLNGGAGEEERAAMTAQRSAFPLRIVFSQPGGEYAVADRVDVSQGAARVAGVDKAGPDPDAQARAWRLRGRCPLRRRTEQRRQVRVGRDGTQIDWRLPDEARR